MNVMRSGSGVNLVRAVLLGLAGGLLVAAWGRAQRRALGSLPHPAQAPPRGEGAPARLAGHVGKLAGEIGERNLFTLAALNTAAFYVEAAFAAQGYEPRSQRYSVQYEDSGPVAVRNIEAVVLARGPDAPVLVVGAHYDSAPGTPGADDNASGVAALLELARRFRGRSGAVELRFVAFSTEEPPFFGSEQMGSAHYAAALAREGRKVAGMLSLEMLGYYSDQPGSQNYPPVLSLFYPSRGNYLGVVSNLSSRAFMARIRDGWKAPGGLPVVGSALPEWLRVITLSDHLWFWRRGWPAVMVTDTAFLRNPHYHEASDLPDQLDYARFADAVDGLEAAISGVAR